MDGCITLVRYSSSAFDKKGEANRMKRIASSTLCPYVCIETSMMGIRRRRRRRRRDEHGNVNLRHLPFFIHHLVFHFSLCFSLSLSHRHNDSQTRREHGGVKICRERKEASLLSVLGVPYSCTYISFASISIAHINTFDAFLPCPSLSHCPATKSYSLFPTEIRSLEFCLFFSL